MKKLFGLRLVQGTISYFITSAEQALPQHLEAAKKAFSKPNQDTWNIPTAPPLSISACRTYAEIDPYVVLEDIAPQDGFDLGIFATKWVPETPVPLERDHKGIRRFKVLDFAKDAAEANGVVQMLKDQKERK